MTDAEFLRLFETCELPYEAWTHRAHVKVAYLYLREDAFPAALVRIRAAIQRFNASKSVPEGPTSGYNETTTHAFLQLVAATMAAHAESLRTSTSDEFCNAHPQLLTKHVLRFFYSPERQLDPRTKTQFVEPDLAPLPRIIFSHGA